MVAKGKGHVTTFKPITFQKKDSYLYPCTVAYNFEILGHSICAIVFGENVNFSISYLDACIPIDVKLNFKADLFSTTF